MNQQTNKQTVATQDGVGFTSYEQSLPFSVQSINRIAGSGNQMSFRGNQAAHCGFVDDILEEHFSISLHHKELVEAEQNKTTASKEMKIKQLQCSYRALQERHWRAGSGEAPTVFWPVAT